MAGMSSSDLNRRRVLQLLGGAGALALAGCASSSVRSGATSTSTTDDSFTTSIGTSAATGTIPEETAGPFPGDGSNGVNVLTQDGVVRRDIRPSFGSSTTVADGVPTTIKFRLADAAYLLINAGFIYLFIYLQRSI
jgi:hypothetical protein